MSVGPLGFHDVSDGSASARDVAVANHTQPRWPEVRRFRWVIAWLGALLAFVVFAGPPTSRTQVFAFVGFGLVASGTTSEDESSWKRVLIDWLPFYVLLTIYDMLRGSVDSWFMPHVIPQVRIDQWLFGGTAPTNTLQHALYTPGVAHSWDYAAFVVYMSHFFVPFIVAALLWKFAHDRFRRYAFLFVTLTFAALVTYAAYPAVPPWLASQSAQLPPTAKIIDEMWAHVHITSGASVFSGASHFANPVAAVPSLHSAYPMLLALFFWPTARRWRGLLILYPLAMGLTLVYTGEHFVIDILLGWLYAVVVVVVGTRVFERWDRRLRLRQQRAVEAGAVDRSLGT